MKTVKSSIKLQGSGLMFAAPVEVELKPSNNRGIRFYVKDSVIEANVDSVVSTDHFVVVADVKNGAKTKVALIEHFMAACAIAEIDALDVYVDSKSFEMPIFDGSAKVWIDEFKKAGTTGNCEAYKVLEEPLYFEKDNTLIALVPSQYDTQITYAVNYKHPDLRNRWVNMTKKNINEIVEARTFGYLSDLKKFQALGFSKGVTLENTVGLKDDGSYTVPLRSEWEPVKHKILDVIGDLYLTGFNPLKMKANILVKEAGHGYHVATSKKLSELLRR